MGTHRSGQTTGSPPYSTRLFWWDTNYECHRHEPKGSYLRLNARLAVEMPPHSFKFGRCAVNQVWNQKMAPVCRGKSSSNHGSSMIFHLSSLESTSNLRAREAGAACRAERRPHNRGQDPFGAPAALQGQHQHLRRLPANRVAGHARVAVPLGHLPRRARGRAPRQPGAGDLLLHSGSAVVLPVAIAC